MENANEIICMWQVIQLASKSKTQYDEIERKYVYKNPHTLSDTTNSNLLLVQLRNIGRKFLI